MLMDEVGLKYKNCGRVHCANALTVKQGLARLKKGILSPNIQKVKELQHLTKKRHKYKQQYQA